MLTVAHGVWQTTLWCMGIATYKKMREIVMNPPPNIDPVLLHLYRDLITRDEAAKRGNRLRLRREDQPVG